MRFVCALDVYANKKLVGMLLRHFDKEKNDCFYTFNYNDDAEPCDYISPLMPVRKEIYKSPFVHSVFQSSLPEGYLRQELIRQFGKIIYPDEMGILMITGQNRVGHIQCVERGKSLSFVDEDDLLNFDDLDRVNTAEISSAVEMLMNKYAARSGVSGVMPKVLASQLDCVTMADSSRLIKLDSIDYPFLSVTEFFCLTAARSSGINVPDFELIMSGRGIALARFDKKPDQSRLGFEDACSLMGFPSNDSRYHASSETLAECIRSIVGGDAQKKTDVMMALFKANVFSHATRNGDAHLKNYGVLFDKDGTVDLAPIYDLVTTTAYPGFVRDDPALSLNNNHDWSDRNGFMLSGRRSYRLSDNQVNAVFLDIEKGINATAQKAVEFLNDDRYIDAKDMLISVLSQWDVGLTSLGMDSNGVKASLSKINEDALFNMGMSS